MLGPAEHPGLEESAVDDRLPTPLEQIKQAYLAFGPVEIVFLVHGQPRHPPAFGGQRVTGAGEGLLLHEELLARSLPLLLRYDRGCVHREMLFPAFLVSLFTCSFLMCRHRHVPFLILSIIRSPSISRSVDVCAATDSPFHSVCRSWLTR